MHTSGGPGATIEAQGRKSAMTDFSRAFDIGGLIGGLLR